MATTGRCHCGATSFSVEGEPAHSALCFCHDCSRASGAPMVGWALFKQDQVTIEGDPVTYASSEHGRRQFCGTCGTGLFYLSEAIFPGQVDIQISTFDDQQAFPPGSRIQIADAPDWVAQVQDLPGFERFPG